ncbi:MAG: alpha-galactosidase, partial [Clostridia bacterium]|nr:alpha-galactosidase [Clostridia bacterium]
ADRAISFYKKYSHIIRDGESHIYGSGTDSYLKPTGWQAVVRRGADGGTLAVIHTFGGKIPEYVALPVDASRISDAVSSENNEISLSGGYLKVLLKANFEAVAVALE